jgi:hypothetical protein
MFNLPLNSLKFFLFLCILTLSWNAYAETIKNTKNLIVSTQKGEESFMPVIADGKVWNFKTDDGKEIKLTLYPNGQGQMQIFFMSKKLTWKKYGNGFCLQGTPDGDKCIKLVQTGNGYKGTEKSGRTMTLTR